MVKFTESFRLHADMAEFLRHEIYEKDGIAFHSRRHTELEPREVPDPFVAAVLRPSTRWSWSCTTRPAAKPATRSSAT